MTDRLRKAQVIPERDETGFHPPLAAPFKSLPSVNMGRFYSRNSFILFGFLVSKKSTVAASFLFSGSAKYA